MTDKHVLLTGATGFVGSAVQPALRAHGWQVRGMSRDIVKARAQAPHMPWVHGNVYDEASCAAALANCQAAFYLVHSIGEGTDFHAREIDAAKTFARAAAAAGVERLVYLGGIAPDGPPSEHLSSRLAVGEALRAGPVPTVELRASMIIGHGSLSWLIVRDLAARLAVMVLPKWLKSRTEPVAIDDIVAALLAAVSMPLEGSACYDVPGPEILSGRAILEKTAQVMGHRQPLMAEVPFLSPRLSALWVRFVTRAKWSVAQQVVLGLKNDVLARDAAFWQRIGHAERLDFSTAAKNALQAERQEGVVPGAWGAVERALSGKGAPAP